MFVWIYKDAHDELFRLFVIGKLLPKNFTQRSFIVLKKLSASGTTIRRVLFTCMRT